MPFTKIHTKPVVTYMSWSIPVGTTKGEPILLSITISSHGEQESTERLIDSVEVASVRYADKPLSRDELDASVRDVVARSRELMGLD